MFRARLLIAAALALGLLAGCSSGRHPSSPAPATAWAKTLSRVKPDGSVDTATALAAFSLAIGPVPGVTAPSGPAETIPSGTLAVQWVLGHWAGLSAAQQHAVLGDLGVVTTAALDRAPAAQPEVACQNADSAGAGVYRAQVAGIESDIVAHIGAGPFTSRVHVAVNNKQLDGADAAMYTYGCGSPPTGCMIHVNPLVATGNFPAAEVRDFLIHEMLHCYLIQKLGSAYDYLPAWYVEGFPMWGENVLGAGSGTATAYWHNYLDSPGTSLFTRVYDAAGFYVHLAETGTDVWHRVLPAAKAMSGGGGSAAGWRAFAPTTAFLDSWGSGYAQGRYPGQPWLTSGPNLPSYQGPIPKTQINNGQTLTVRATTAATAISDVDVGAQILLVTGTGDGRISLDGGADATLAQAAGVAYSTGSPGTACPAGTGTDLTHLSPGDHYVTVTGGLSAGLVSLQGLSLAAYCARPAKPCLVGTWTSTLFQAATKAMTENGGAGVVLRITGGGAMSVDFDGMKPVALSGKFQAGLTFSGKISGHVVLPADAQPGVAYDWKQAPGTKTDYDHLDAAVHVTSPIDYTYGPVSVLAMAKSMGSESSEMSTQPLSGGTWTCSGNTLVIHAPPNVPSDGTWTWSRS